MHAQLLFVLSAGDLWKKQCKQVVKHNRGSTSNTDNKVGGPFPCIYCEKGFKSWVVGKKVVSVWSKSACKSDPSLLVRRVFFPTTCACMYQNLTWLD
jgi:hypothetical protein